ncbi:sugar ABC transporter substrate-binding protein [Enterococcus alcedinis]|uniref:Sugar ABC transporter substrate-binding protein n=1 Tax=Enterococcus alcedinis TaxID=1274384 RepID=A0A917N504_9ENTE|nr:sugar ABC transporter substrate-binding protein [Enterococcus alcedinis]MBP2101961.1 multiple sugar transport system substrate-binding protein [Enterococcus alcedinis]GGI65524.1 sugar ABC transporter substrate-binding protein [Enterococcus alcedinis]
MNRKSFAVLSLLSLSLLGACSSEKPTEENAAASTDAVELHFTFWGDPLEKKSIEDLVGAFNKENPDIKVTTQNIPHGNYMEKMNTMASANKLPDVGYFMEDNLGEWMNSGQIRDLSALYEPGQPFEGKLKEGIFQFEEDGPIAGNFNSLGAITMYYNEAYFEENGIDLPPHKLEDAWEWEEFIDVSKQLTVDRNGKHPGEDGFDEKNIETYAVNNFAGFTFESFLASNGGGVVSQDNKQILIGTEESIEAIQNLQDLMYVHHVMPKPSQASTIPSTDTALLTNRVVMSIGGSWDLNGLGKAIREKGLKIGSGILPKMGEEVRMMNYGAPIVVFENDNTKENFDEVQKFLEFVNDPENSLPIINSGLWRPNETSWYTDKDKLAKWTETDITPDNYIESFVEPVKTNLVRNKAFFNTDTAQIGDIVGPSLEQVWTGKKSAEEVVKEDILPKLKKTFGDKYEYVE